MTDKTEDKRQIIEDKNQIKKELIESNRIKSNHFAAVILLCFNIVGITAFLVDRFYLNTNQFPFVFFIIITLIAVIIPVIVFKDQGNSVKSRLVLVGGMLVYNMALLLFTPPVFWLGCFVPVLCTIRYCYPNFTIGTGALSFVLLLAALMIRRTDPVNMMIYLPTMVVVAVLSYIISKNGLFMIERTAKLVEDRNEAEKAAHDMKTNIMISQIQPHFLYNTLMAITGIEGNPPETMDAIADFGQYLRENLHILQTRDAIPFEDEIRHVELYVSLEKLRFENKLNVEMDLEATDFGIPPLTIQMLVENAIKHGVSKKINGGTVKVRSIEQDGFYVITVDDDGIGFDADNISKISSEHIGLHSVKDRLKEMVNGEMDIRSMPGKGTTVTLKIPTGNPKPEKRIEMR